MRPVPAVIRGSPGTEARLVEQRAQQDSVHGRNELWVIRKNLSYRATSAWPVTDASAPTPACRKVTTANRQATPPKIPAASRVREPTSPERPPDSVA